jgi:spermidine/putrescine transport system substrate-binding protein
MRDVTGLVMLELGSNPADFSRAEFNAALRVLGQSVQAGQIAFSTNYYLPPLLKGRLVACVGWAGDVLFAREHDPDIQFTWPSGGGMLWTSNMVIPAPARHGDNAERLMSFYYQPSVAARLAAYERYLCPVAGTKSVMRGLDPALAVQQFMFPGADLLSSGHTFKVLTPMQSATLTSAYQIAVGL